VTSVPRLVCLVVTHDDGDRLPAWIEAVRPLADAIMALDQGSSDGSAEILAREPLVRTLLHGVAESRVTAVNRMLDAAGSLDADWLLWLDVTERVPRGDVEPLRAFLARDALPGLAYGLRSGDGRPAFRLFAHRSGQRLAPEASDDTMVPAAIPPERWLATTLRLEPVTASRPAPDRAPDTPVLVPRERSWFQTLRAVRRRGRGLAQLGFAGSAEAPPRSHHGPQERVHSGAVRAALYPLHPHHPWLARVPTRIRRSLRRSLTRAAVRAHLRRCRHVVIVAVTGSAGKTTTKDLIGEMLAAGGPTVRTWHNANGLWGVPASLLSVRTSDRFAVIEVGIKEGPGEMRWMAGLFRPRVAVLTGIGTFHSEVFGSAEAIAREKRELLRRLGPRGTAVVNADDPLARATARRLPCRVVLAGWAADADVRLLAARTAWPHGLDLELEVRGRRMRGRVGVHGRYLAPLVAMAVAAADAAGVPADAALDAAGTFTPRVGRFSPTPGPRGSMLIVDDWKSRVASAVAAIEALGDTQARRRIVVLGEVQVDEQTTATYRPIAEALAAAADRVVAVGRAGPPLEPLLARTHLADRLLRATDAAAAAAALSEELGPGDVALLHGAGHHDLELIALLLDPDTDPAWVRDWRTRPAARVGRPVTEVLGFVDDAAMLDRHGEALTYAGITGHRLTREGDFIPAGDADIVGRCTSLGVAPLLTLRVAEPAAAVSHALRAAAEHVVTHGHRGILLDPAGGSATAAHVEQLVAGLTDRLHAEGLWAGIVLRSSRHARLAATVDFAVLDLAGGPSPAEGTLAAVACDVRARAVLLQVPDGGSAVGDLTVASSLVRDLGLRGLAVPAASMPHAAQVIGHRFQIRRRAWPAAEPWSESHALLRLAAAPAVR
jgi:UDP-N-acetylmuramoyl-tripeptide--D-alanyl-D-alanine ligase